MTSKRRVGKRYLVGGVVGVFEELRKCNITATAFHTLKSTSARVL